MIQKYLSGELDKKDDTLTKPHWAGMWQHGTAAEEPPLDTGSQQSIADEICNMVKEGMELKNRQEQPWQAEDDEDEQHRDGCGQRCAHLSLNAGCILFVAPTGRLAATLREKVPDLHIDIIHRALTNGK